jgi:hypothetical protein
MVSGAPPDTSPTTTMNEPEMPAEPQKVLVVGTRTAACNELVHELTRRAARGPTAFTLVVPTTPSGWAWLADMHSGGVDAERYLDAAVERYRAAGLEVDSAHLGDPDPIAAVMDAVHFATYDEVVVCTLPRNLSKWLGLSLPHRIRAVTGLPVTHVVGRQTRLSDKAHGRRGGHRPVDRRSVYLDGQGAAQVLGLEDARSQPSRTRA